MNILFIEIFYIILSIKINRTLTHTEDDPIPTFLTTVGNTSAEYTQHRARVPMLLARPTMFKATVGHSFVNVHLKKIVCKIILTKMSATLHQNDYPERQFILTYGVMNMVAIRATPVVVNKIMQDNRLPQFISNVSVTQNAGISIAEIVDLSS